MLKKIKITWDVTLMLLATAAAAAQIRKDIKTHAEHDSHNPCACNKQCLKCAF